MLGVASCRSGLDAARCPPEEIPSWGLADLPVAQEQAIRSQDVLHAPARPRAQGMLKRFQRFAGEFSGMQASKHLVEDWMLLVMVCVYLGESTFLKNVCSWTNSFTRAFCLSCKPGLWRSCNANCVTAVCFGAWCGGS